MIEFECEKCGRAMRVPDAAAGKKGNCKSCAAEIIVPLRETDEFDLANESLDELMAAPPLLSKKRAKKTEDLESEVEVVDMHSETSSKKRIKVDFRSPLMFGAIATACGGLGLLVCWMPMFGILAFLLCFVGLGLGAVAVVKSIRGSMLELGVSIAGVLVSLLTLFVTTGLTFVVMAPGITTYYKEAKDARATMIARSLGKKDPKRYFEVMFRNLNGSQWRFVDLNRVVDGKREFRLTLMFGVRSFHEKPIKALPGRLTITHVKEGVIFNDDIYYEVDVTDPGYGNHPVIINPYDGTDPHQRLLRFADVKDLSLKFDPIGVEFADGTIQKF